MYNFYKYRIIPEERFNNTKNPRVYINRFQELAKKSFYFDNDRLYYVKSYSCKRLEDCSFEERNEVNLKRIPFIYQILPKLDELHSGLRTYSKSYFSKKIFRR